MTWKGAHPQIGHGCCFASERAVPKVAVSCGKAPVGKVPESGINMCAFVGTPKLSLSFWCPLKPTLAGGKTHYEAPT